MKSKFPMLLAFLMAGIFSFAAEDTSLRTNLQAALKFRIELAASVTGKKEDPEQAIVRLRGNRSASGLPVSSEVDFAEAALDIGLRLIGLDQPAAAEVFFRAAETAFDEMVKAASVSQSREKARYLERLSMVRGKFLNKAAQAKADIEEAIRLQPEDKSLVAAQTRLARGRGIDLKSVQVDSTNAKKE